MGNRRPMQARRMVVVRDAGCNLEGPDGMAQPMSSPVLPNVLPAVTRSNSITSINSTSSGASLRRRSRTQTRTLTRDVRRGKSVGPSTEAPRRSPSGTAGVRPAFFVRFSPAHSWPSSVC